MLKFIGDHLGTIVQFGVTLWMASIARSFQVSMAVFGTRLDTHREAVKRSRELWWYDEHTENWVAKMNEHMDWLAINEVYLEPAAAQAFRDVHLFKGLQRSVGHQPLDITERFNGADKAMDILRRELLRFRKRTLCECLREASSARLNRTRRPTLTEGRDPRRAAALTASALMSSRRPASSACRPTPRARTWTP